MLRVARTISAEMMMPDNRTIEEWHDEWTDLHVKERAAFDEVRELTGPAIKALAGSAEKDVETIKASLSAYDRWDAANKAVAEFFVRFRAAAP